MTDVDVAIIGGGCIGLAIASALKDDCRRVMVIERDNLGRESTHAAGGMLAPIMELEFEEFDMLELGVRSLRLCEDFATRLSSSVGMDLDYRRNGTLFVALQPRQLSDLERLYEYQRRIGLQAEKLTASRLKDKEPLLADNVRAGIFVESEEKIDNRKFSAALAFECRQKGVELHTNDPLVQIEYAEDGKIELLRTLLLEIRPKQVVIAAGAWSGMLPGLKPEDSMPLRA
ncbi:MAG: NAD(P)/FAD-dependent oxidoreductase, partial [bacterium]